MVLFGDILSQLYYVPVTFYTGYIGSVYQQIKYKIVGTRGKCRTQGRTLYGELNPEGIVCICDKYIFHRIVTHGDYKHACSVTLSTPHVG